MIDSKIIFFYFIWGEECYWNNLILSLILLRKKYPQNKIKVVSYTKNIPEYFLKYPAIINFEFNVMECYFDKNYKDPKASGPKVQDLNNFYDTHRRLSSKVIDCLEMTEKNEKVILLDSDVFVIKRFDNINWDKIGVYIIGKYNFNPSSDLDDYVIHANTGVITFAKLNSRADLFESLFKEEVHKLATGNFKQTDYIIKSCGKAWLEWRCRGLAESLNCDKDQIKSQIDNDSAGFWVQEEMITRRLIDTYGDLFFNITLNNNGFIFLQGDKRTQDFKQLKKYNNIHLFNFLNYNISSLIINIDYFREKIIDHIQDDHIKNLEIPSHLKSVAITMDKFLKLNEFFL